MHFSGDLRTTWWCNPT